MVSAVDPERVQWDKCGVTFRAMIYLKRHIINSHTEDPVLCRIWNRTMRNKWVARDHLRNLHNSEYVAAEWDLSLLISDLNGGEVEDANGTPSEI